MVDPLKAVRKRKVHEDILVAAKWFVEDIGVEPFKSEHLRPLVAPEGGELVGGASVEAALRTLAEKLRSDGVEHADVRLHGLRERLVAANHAPIPDASEKAFTDYLSNLVKRNLLRKEPRARSYRLDPTWGVIEVMERSRLHRRDIASPTNRRSRPAQPSRRVLAYGMRGGLDAREKEVERLAGEVIRLAAEVLAVIQSTGPASERAARSAARERSDFVVAVPVRPDRLLALAIRSRAGGREEFLAAASGALSEASAALGGDAGTIEGKMFAELSDAEEDEAFERLYRATSRGRAGPKFVLRWPDRPPE